MNLQRLLHELCSDGCGNTECNTWINHSADGTSVVCNSGKATGNKFETALKYTAVSDPDVYC